MNAISVSLRAIVQALESRAANTDTDWRWRAATAIRDCPEYEQSVLPVDDDSVAAANKRADAAELLAKMRPMPIDVDDLKEQLAAANKRTDEVIRRLQHMHQAHSDSVQWYQNAVAQALKSLDALPRKLEFYL